MFRISKYFSQIYFFIADRILSLSELTNFINLTHMTANTPKRLLALDILRGITIAGMILVNNPGSWGYVYTPLEHAAFNGLTPTDLVFPFFMFIMGISTYISLRKYNFTYSHATLRKIVKRTVVIFCIGLFLNLLAKSKSI